MKEFSFLLPRCFRPLGVVLTGIGILLLIIRFYYGIKPELFNLKVFAIFSSYLESKYLEVVKNQMIEEFGGLPVLVGLFMIAFSKEKNENKNLNALRLKSFFIAAYLNTIFLIGAILFTYGFGFVYMMILNLILWFIIYLISFRIMIYLYNKDSENN